MYQASPFILGTLSFDLLPLIHITKKSHFGLLALFILLFPSFSLTGVFQEIDKLLQKGNEREITVDLREPLYNDGVLSTEKGGVISASGIRIQALHLRYTHKIINQTLVWTIEGEGNLMIEFGEYIFVGNKLFYNFQTKEGVIEHGKTSLEPWYFGGERLELRADGSYIIYHGYLTTSEKNEPDWGIYSQTLHLQENNLMAQDVRVKIFNYTVLWVPALKTNLNFIFDNPVRYRFRWGGRQGPRLGLTYEIFSWKYWKTFVRFDYRLARGPGGGIETRYRSLDRKTEFHSINYLAKDYSILGPHKKTRYRLEGNFQKLMDRDKTSILLTYDKISDRDMPSNYYDRDFDFDTSKRSQLRIRRGESVWIGNFYTRIRINSFQTVKQELPTFETNFKPFELGQTGIIFGNTANASYLNFEYSKSLSQIHNYSSSRFQYFPTLYRPIVIERFGCLTPEIGMITIFYGDGPKHDAQWLMLGKSRLTLQTQLYRYYNFIKHVVKPYASYYYYSTPLSCPRKHYIFDLSDGWTRLNYLSFGINNSFYTKHNSDDIKCIGSASLYSFAFFDTHTIHQTIPRIYGKLSFFSSSKTKHILDTAWNLEHNQFDYLNLRNEWTVSTNFAITLEYRYRGPYWWRKVDRENFFLDMIYSEQKLKCSLLSDRKNTLLVHFFYRFHPNWACEFTSRQGWNRKKEPNYLEFEFDVFTTIQTAWNLRLSYQHQEHDKRVAMYLNIGLRHSIRAKKSKKIAYFE